MDIRCQHIKTGEVKVLPEKVFAQVQHKYKFLSYVQDPNVRPPSIPKEPVVLVDNMAGIEKVVMVETVSETLEQAKARYFSVMGKKAGNKSVSTIQKELNEYQHAS